MTNQEPTGKIDRFYQYPYAAIFALFVKSLSLFVTWWSATIPSPALFFSGFVFSASYACEYFAFFEKQNRENKMLGKRIGFFINYGLIVSAAVSLFFVLRVFILPLYDAANNQWFWRLLMRLIQLACFAHLSIHAFEVIIAVKNKRLLTS